MTDYEAVIGLEVHVELATKTKIFCGCSTAFGAPPNTHCCPVCTAMPGVLPVLNKAVLDYSIAVGLATNCEITRYGKFDRKNYFYPDLPKAFQTSQLYLPICTNGYLMIDDAAGNKKQVRLREIHMEEDAGKLLHAPDGRGTLVDYNRCGVPLLEIVSQPDLRSAEEVINYLETLRSILLYLGVSDCKLEEGSIRADVNLSLRPVGSAKLGTRTEMKNLNSFRAISRAIAYESGRQEDILRAGGEVDQETRRWQDDKNYSTVMRSKENAHDYRYFPEPDLLPMEISDEWIAEIAAGLPELPQAKLARYEADFGLNAYDAGLLVRSARLAAIFEEVVNMGASPKETANFLNGECARLLRENNAEPEALTFSARNLAGLLNLLAKGRINHQVAKEVFAKIYYEDIDPVKYVKVNGLEMMQDSGEMEEVIRRVIAENPQAVEDYKSGKQKAIGLLVGQTMKATSGRANPAEVNRLLKEFLAE